MSHRRRPAVIKFPINQFCLQFIRKCVISTSRNSSFLLSRLIDALFSCDRQLYTTSHGVIVHTQCLNQRIHRLVSWISCHTAENLIQCPYRYTGLICKLLVRPSKFSLSVLHFFDARFYIHTPASSYLTIFPGCLFFHNILLLQLLFCEFNTLRIPFILFIRNFLTHTFQ